VPSPIHAFGQESHRALQLGMRDSHVEPHILAPSPNPAFYLQPKHLASAFYAIEDTRVIDRYVLLGDNFDDLLGDHASRYC